MRSRHIVILNTLCLLTMLYNIDWDIEFKANGKSHRLAFLTECEIFSSVDNLTDTAVIVLPEMRMNRPIDDELRSKVERGSEVTIRLGYNGDVRTEFVGFVREITTNDSSLKIHCEDALFLFRKGIPDVEMKPASLKEVAQYVVDHVDGSYTVSCDYEINYEKFTIHQATGFDVLKKLQEETAANVYFDTEHKILHIHPPYLEKGGQVRYSMQQNVETSSLEFNNLLDYKVEVTVESTDINGGVHQITVGTTGGDKKTHKTRKPMNEASMRRVAEGILKRATAPRYEGNFDAWLVPFVKPTYSARIVDDDYPDKTGWYYVKSVTTSISENGGKRTVTPGVKLS